MMQRIRRFGIGQTAKFLAVLYALVGVVLIPFFLLAALASPTARGFGMGLVILFPILYGLCGLIGGAIGAALYNLVARWVGGLEVEIVQGEG
jgi:hypothetical protein